MRSMYKKIPMFLSAAIVMLGTTGVMAAGDLIADPEKRTKLPAAPEPGVYILGALGLLIVAAYWAYRRHHHRANVPAN